TQFNKNRIVQKSAAYYPIIPRLKLQYADSERSKLLRYRSNYVLNTNTYCDIFDGHLYKRLLHNGMIKDERDLIFSASLDGYQIFQQHRDDNWVIIFINNNIPPEDRVKQENLLIAAIIPGVVDLKSGINHVYYPLKYTTTNGKKLYNIKKLPLRDHKSYLDKVSIWKAASNKKKAQKDTDNWYFFVEAAQIAIKKTITYEELYCLDDNFQKFFKTYT
ncbi:15425_t:CDS:2, partial [Cetraspora pellucida]